MGIHAQAHGNFGRCEALLGDLFDRFDLVTPSLKRCGDFFVSIDTSMKPHSEAGGCLENPG